MLHNFMFLAKSIPAWLRNVKILPASMAAPILLILIFLIDML